MALVFKIKHEDTLRRWVVSESINAEMFPVTLEKLQVKVRELFQFPLSAVLAITYADKENDLVTLGDDRDLVDACLVQCLNPLRLQVQVLESKGHDSRDASQQAPDNLNMEGFLKFLFPQATTEALQHLLQRYAELLDPSLPIATLIVKAQDAFKEFLAHAPMSGCYKPGPSEKPAHHHPYKHPSTSDVRCRSMPTHRAGEQISPPKDAPFALHLGVQCDGCGASPIRGPRYMSNKLPNFDLCSACYQEKGNEEDYDKIEHPVHGPSFHDCHYRPPYLRKGFKQVMGPPMCGRGMFARGPYGWRPDCAFVGGHDEHKKLDARFMKDVTIFDGTELAPGTKFTKIWRLGNSGSLPWPQNTQLLHIGGDVLSLQEAVTLELPESGLACGEEVEVSVDLTAPEKAGRYISHWRLISPSGQKFGQRVWVTIQVVPQGEQSPMLQESLKEGEGKGNGTPTTIVVPIVSAGDAERKDEMMVEGSSAGPSSSRNVADVKVTDTNYTPEYSIGTSTTIVVPIVSAGDAERKDGMMVEGFAGPSSSLDVADVKGTETNYAPDISEGLEGFSLVEKPVDLNDEERKNNAANDASVDKNEQEPKLHSLESMGFVDRGLNAVLLSKNDGNVQRTLDDLLVAAGWNGALGDLLEMGFTDQATNVKLLMKHKGSVKAAVRDLVQMEKQKA